MAIDRLKDQMDHGSLVGLGDDDHPQYVLKAVNGVTAGTVALTDSAYPLGMSHGQNANTDTGWPTADFGVHHTVKRGTGGDGAQHWWGLITGEHWFRVSAVAGGWGAWQRLDKKTVRIPHTWHIPGEVKVASGDTDFLLPFFVPINLSGAVSATVAVVYTRVNSGTSVTWNLTRTTYAGTTTNIATGLFAAGGSNAGDTIGVALNTGNPDRLAPVVTAVNGTPKNMTITIAVDYTF